MAARADLRTFYEGYYEPGGNAADAARFREWRRLSAVGKADHVVALAAGLPGRVRSVVDVGCGDGALLAELRRRGFAVRLAGAEIADSAARRAREQAGVQVDVFDGARLPYRDGEFDLAILSHVLEHAPDPAALLAEARRVAASVIVEVPLEANLSARRGSKRRVAESVGHLHAFDRRRMRALAGGAGLRVAGELTDPLPLAVHRFHARGAREQARATAKWLVRRALAAAPPVAERLFTLHYAALLLPR